MQNLSDNSSEHDQEKRSIVEEIENKLKEIPNIKYEITPNHVIVHPMSEKGFTVELDIHNGDYILTFNGNWHTNISNQQEAFGLFGFALCNKCRLKILSRGKTQCRWTVQQLEDDKWVDFSTMALLLFPFWRKKHVLYLQNNVIQ